MIGSLSLAALLGIVALLLPDLIGNDEEILLSTLLFAIYSLLALCCAIVAEKRKLVILMWIGIGSSVISLLIWLVITWFNPSWSWHNVAKVAGTFTTVAVVIALSRPARGDSSRAGDPGRLGGEIDPARWQVRPGGRPADT